MERVADYNGWTNWETWNTALMMDNEQESYNEARRIVERYDYNPQMATNALRDWAIETVIAPTNAMLIQDAQEWNDVPEWDRLDPHYEDLKERNPDAAGFVNELGFGPDVSDYTPNTIDPELVNWDEIVENIMEELEAEKGDVEYEDPDAPGDMTIPNEWVSKTAITDDWGGFDWGSQHSQGAEYYEQRRPWWYNLDTGEAFIGEAGSYHPQNLPWGNWVKGEYWPQTGEINTTNMDQSPESQALTAAAEEAVKRQLFPPQVQDENPADRAMREYEERMRQAGWVTADADGWWEPQMTNRNEGVKIPGEAPGMPRNMMSDKPAEDRCPHCGRPTPIYVTVCPECGMRIRPGFEVAAKQKLAMAILPSDKAQQFTQHLQDLAQDNKIQIRWVDDYGYDPEVGVESGDGYAYLNTREIRIPPIVHDVDYLLGLHEIAHLLLPWDDEGVEGLADWWAIEHSLIPITPEMRDWISHDRYANFNRLAAFEGAPALWGDPDPSNNWLYLKGKVAFGDNFWALAQRLGDELGLGEPEVKFISNQIARNHLPPEWDVAYGEIENGRPRIWASTVDRNHVWDMVKEGLGVNAGI